MKILSLSLDNGVAKTDSVLARRTCEYGDLVDAYYVIVPDKNNGELELSPKVRVYRVAGAIKPFQLYKIFIQAKAILKKDKFDIITVQDAYYLALIGWILAIKYGLGLELQIHGFEKFSFSRERLAKFILRRADSIRAVSQRLKKNLENEFGVKPEKITVVPVYADIKKTEFSSPGKNKNGGIIFLSVGRLVAGKRVDLQIRAVARLINEFPDIKLWVVGAGPERKKLENLVKNFRLEKNVEFFGFQEDLAKYYSRADIYVLTSDSEGWGLSVIEAAAFGLPIIMTDVGCAGEIIINGKSGLIIPAGSLRGLAEAIPLLINDSKLRETLGRGAKESLKQLLTKEETSRLYKKSWEKALINN